MSTCKLWIVGAGGLAPLVRASCGKAGCHKVQSPTSLRGAKGSVASASSVMLKGLPNALQFIRDLPDSCSLKKLWTGEGRPQLNETQVKEGKRSEQRVNEDQVSISWDKFIIFYKFFCIFFVLSKFQTCKGVVLFVCVLCFHLKQSFTSQP